MYTEEQLSAGFRLGDWTVLPARSVLVRDDEERVPEPLVFRLLVELARHDGELVSKDELIAAVWDNRAMSDAPVNRAITQLRKVLDDTDRPYRYVENVSKRGYRLKPPVEIALAAPAAKRQSSFAPRLVAVGAVLLGAILVWMVLPQPEPVQNERQAIGVLPFEDLSPEAGNAYLVDAFREELVSSLYTLPDLAVVTSRLAYEDAEVHDVARALDVDSVLEGSVQRIGERLKVFYKITDAQSGVLLLSGSLEGDLESHFELQIQLANAVRRELLGESEPTLITRRKPQSFAAYDRYMRGLFALDARQTSTSLEEAIRLFDETIELDPTFGPAYVMLATAYSLLPTYRDVGIDEASRLALDALDRGLAVDPSIADTAAAIRGFDHHRHMRWQASEQAFRKAVAADVVDPTAFIWYSRMLASVGRLEDSHQYALAALRLDPTSAVLNSRLAMSYTWLEDYDKALEFFERAQDLGAGGSTYQLAFALCLFERGNVERARALTMAANATSDTEWIDPVFAALEDAAQATAALSAVDAAAMSGRLSPQAELIVRIMLDDVDGAASVAERLVNNGEIFEMDLLFISQTRALREHERFDALTEDLGLKEYWRQRNCEWQGHSFACG